MPGTTASLTLRSLADLEGERFYIPEYQRGYRWTEQQVTALLDDLFAFQRTQPPVGTYYCLQPVVVHARADGSWEVVDGQQRLTTLFLILRALPQGAGAKDLFTLEYATRDSSKQFLEDPSEHASKDTIDFHHMYHATRAIETWLGDSKRGRAAAHKLLMILTDPDNEGPNTRVIWYEIADKDPVEAFIRLNVGHIPLTSAELIRAQFLRQDNDATPHARSQIAEEWYQLERRLQDDRFWFFLQSGAEAPPARIEYVFDVFVRANEAPVGVALDDPLYTFHGFNAYLRKHGKGLSITDIWRNVEHTARVLEEWYDDRRLFHLVGFLVATTPKGRSAGEQREAGASLLVELLELRLHHTSTAFDRLLRARAWPRFLGKTQEHPPKTMKDLEAKVSERMASLQYRPGSQAIRTALLLFNIAGLLENDASTQRFQFEHFKLASWDIEHVRSSVEHMPQSPPGRIRWLEHAKPFLETPAARSADKRRARALFEEAEDLLSSKAPDKARFEKLFGEVRELSGEADARASDDELSNLALLDTGTNRSYKNAIFPVKRQRVIQLDRQGTFVPPATRNVFLKYYSPNAAQLLTWDADDQKAYGREIERTLVSFFAPIVEAQ